MTSAGNLSDHPLSGGCELTCAPAPTNSVFVASSRQRLRDFRDQQAFDQLGPRRLSLLLDRSPKAITFEPSCGAGRWRRVGVASSAPQVYASPNGAACSPAFPRSPSSAVMSFNVITPSTSSLSASPQPTGHRRIRMANRGGDSTADGSSQEPERDARPQHPRRAAGGHNRRLVNRGEQRCQQHSN
jgi:hypothetical protein